VGELVVLRGLCLKEWIKGNGRGGGKNGGEIKRTRWLRMGDRKERDDEIVEERRRRKTEK